VKKDHAVDLLAMFLPFMEKLENRMLIMENSILEVETRILEKMDNKISDIEDRIIANGREIRKM
jgi:hypothetical protein